MADISRIGIRPGQFPGELPQRPDQTKKSEGPSFGETLKGLIGDVDKMQKTAEETTKRMLTGEIEDVHQVMVAMEEAQTSFQLMMEIRNKIVDAYKEVMRMQV
jgi:flagellar hook-basal body complex protein FliE